MYPYDFFFFPLCSSAPVATDAADKAVGISLGGTLSPGQL